MNDWKEVIKAKPHDNIEKLGESFLGFSSKHFTNESIYYGYKNKLNQVQDKKAFNKALAKIYKNNNKQPLTQNDIDSAASNLIYNSTQQNNQISGAGVRGGNDYGWS